MKKKKSLKSPTARFEVALRKPIRKKKYILKLFITGGTSQSTRAIINIKRICDEHLKGRCDLEIIDVYRHPELARKEQIIGAPTLMKLFPLPLRKMLGDLSDTQRTLILLDLNHKKSRHS